jgi:PAS domain S-box-containing protein
MSGAGWSATDPKATQPWWRSILQRPRSTGWTTNAPSYPIGVSGRIALALTVLAIVAAGLIVVVEALEGLKDLPLVALAGGVAGFALLIQWLLRRDTSDLLAQSRKQWFATADRGLAHLDRSMHIVEANAKMAALFGVDESELIDTHFGRYLAEADREAVAKQLESLLNGVVRAAESDNLAVRADGSRVWVHWRATAIKNAYGDFESFHVTLEDITNKHAAEETATASLAELENLNHLKSEFASMVSHEFRTALTGIQGMSELMMSGALEPAEVVEYASHIFKESERVNRLISDMLDLDRLDAGKMKMRMASVDLNATIINAIESMQASSPRHQLVSDLDLKAEMVRGDADRLQQVVTNLLSNAIKYSPNGGEVTVTTKLRAGWVEVSVSDHGIGIPADFADRLFGRFERYENTPSKVIGAGLGLAIARQIVEMHGGRIWAESKQGAGSVFRFTVPVASAGPSRTEDGESRAHRTA